MLEAMITVIPMIAVIATTLAVGIIYFRLAALQISANIISDKVAMNFFTAQAADKNTGAIESNQEIGTVIHVGMYSGIARYTSLVGSDPGGVYGYMYNGENVAFPEKTNKRTYQEPLMKQFGNPINFFSDKENLDCKIKLPEQDGVGREHVVVYLTDRFEIPFYGLAHYLGFFKSKEFTQTATSISNSFYPSYAYNTLNFTDYTVHYFERNSEILKFVDWFISYLGRE